MCRAIAPTVRIWSHEDQTLVLPPVIWVPKAVWL
jgi:hypothetical protein